MFESESITLWRDADVIDPKGDKIGSLESVYVDTATDEPFVAGLKVGIIGRHRLVFVPLTAATVGPGYVRVRYDKDLVRNAPGIETDGEMAADMEPTIFAHYSMDYSPGASGERRLARR
ncbi:PRC-barrel domain protein [Motilibacter peucedani]|uniref:PRC-barrel domain protein n=1 Tax=Motilibacter peucedani TaxID=598650 RepID=A0A420XP71_9ACTN|nr:PRC-barrel domain-containing protein [Motilibacter peucedani]RKS73984.1 PRC-barrel domain protein [Motilibacter peucedani]